MTDPDLKHRRRGGEKRQSLVQQEVYILDVKILGREGCVLDIAIAGERGNYKVQIVQVIVKCLFSFLFPSSNSSPS